MPDMTLQEALQTDEVKGFLGTLIQEAVAEIDIADVVKAALDEHLPTLRESVTESLNEGVRERGQLRSLHTEAVKLINASSLRGAAKANLLEDYSLVESGEDVKPGRALALIEAEMDDDGETVKKTAQQVLTDAVKADVERTRNVLRESAPSFPVAPGGGGEIVETPAEAQFLGEESPNAKFLRERGMDPAQFGATPTPTPAT